MRHRCTLIIVKERWQQLPYGIVCFLLQALPDLLTPGAFSIECGVTIVVSLGLIRNNLYIFQADMPCFCKAVCHVRVCCCWPFFLANLKSQ